MLWTRINLRRRKFLTRLLHLPLWWNIRNRCFIIYQNFLYGSIIFEKFSNPGELGKKCRINDALAWPPFPNQYISYTVVIQSTYIHQRSNKFQLFSLPLLFVLEHKRVNLIFFFFSVKGQTNTSAFFQFESYIVRYVSFEKIKIKQHSTFFFLLSSLLSVQKKKKKYYINWKNFNRTIFSFVRKFYDKWLSSSLSVLFFSFFSPIL